MLLKTFSDIFIIFFLDVSKSLPVSSYILTILVLFTFRTSEKYMDTSEKETNISNIPIYVYKPVKALNFFFISFASFLSIILIRSFQILNFHSVSPLPHLLNTHTKHTIPFISLFITLLLFIHSFLSRCAFNF